MTKTLKDNPRLLRKRTSPFTTATATLPNKCLTFHRYGLGLRWLEARVGYLRKAQNAEEE